MDVNNKYGTLKLQQYYLKRIEDFDLYCSQNDIDYSMAYGTLLGAVRHKGFIPWDDDIDVMMTRTNYDKFLRCFDEKPMEDYILVESLWIKRLSLINNPFFTQELQCIDIFVLDVVPKTKILAGIKVLLLRFLQGMLKENVNYNNYSFLNRLLLFVTHLCGLPFSQERKRFFYDKVARWQGLLGGSDYISISNAEFAYLKHFFKKNIISRYIHLAFEGLNLQAVEGYDEYLTTIYGDYMKPPKEDFRKPKHFQS